MEDSPVKFCEFAEVSDFLLIGRTCRLDRCCCFNYDKPDLVASCPTLAAFRQGKPVGETLILDYPGVPHVVRSGPFGDFVTGMPPNYLRGKIRDEKRGEVRDE